MAGLTNKGKFMALEALLHNVTRTNLYVALVTSATAPGPDHNTLGELTQIAIGNGYADGGYQLTPNTTDFDVYVEDDATDIAYFQVKDVPWTASGGPIPASGSGARYAVLTDDNVTIADRKIIAFWDLEADREVSVTQTLTLKNCQINSQES